MVVHAGGRGFGHSSRAALGPIASLSLDFLSSTSLDSRITFSRTTTGTFVGSNGLIQTAAINGPRFDYDPVTLAARGLLIEEQRTNLLTYSEQFDNAVWTKSSATITANAATAPDGTLTADKLEATGIAPSVYQDATVTGTSAVLSAYMKKGSGADKANVLLLRNQSLGTNLVAVRVNLDSGAITYLAGSSGATATDAGNGWWRVVVTASITSGNIVRAGLLGGYSAVSGDFSYFWGAQLESGSFPTAYIPTVASQVTRTADVATMTGANFSSWFNAAEGSLVIDIRSQDNKTLASLSDGTGSNRMASSAGGLYHLYVAAGGVEQANIDAGTFPVNTSAKLAFAYAANNFAAVINGGTVGTDTSGSVPVVNRLSIGMAGDNTSQINGWVRSIRFYPTRLSNAQLQALTA